MRKPWRFLTLNPISATGLARLPAGTEAGPEIGDPDAILVRSQNLQALELPASLKAIGRAGAGVDNIPVSRCSARGLPVFNTPGANANAVKELVLAGLLMGARNLVPALRFVSGLTGDEASLRKAVEAGKKQFAGFELPRRVLGVIGLGAIGGLVADAALKLGMRVIGFDPTITVDAAWRLPSLVTRANTLDELLRESEFVSLHVPLSDATRNLIDARRVAQLRPGVVLLNFARQEVVDEAALRAALDGGKIRAFLCDYPSLVLDGHPRYVAFPHLGASTQEAEENCAVMVVDQVLDFLANGNIRNAVNLPDVEMGRESAFRVAVANANVPNMVGQISTAMAQAGLNIHNMMNKSKGEMAYTLVDLDSPVPEEVIRRIAAIGGVLSTRSLPAETGGGAR